LLEEGGGVRIGNCKALGATSDFDEGVYDVAIVGAGPTGPTTTYRR
jgi:ribulose 1,5-bisphosphate synthetase/thiazole synthase